MRLVQEGNIKVEIHDNQLIIYEKIREDEVIKTHWIKEKYHGYHYGGKLVQEILGAKLFEFPKSLCVIIDILKLTSTKDSIILDFFAGSGTTGHSVLALNKEDGGNRQFILCTNNEDYNNTGGGIAETVTYPRIKKVIKGYHKHGDGHFVDGLSGNLEYLKCTFAKDYVKKNNYRTGQSELGDLLDANVIDDDIRIKLTRQAGYMIAVSENTLEEISLNNHYQVFTNYKKNKTASIYFSENRIQLKTLLETINTYNNSILYAMDLYSLPIEYENSNIVIKDIPKPILEIYQSIGLINEI